MCTLPRYSNRDSCSPAVRAHGKAGARTIDQDTDSDPPPRGERPSERGENIQGWNRAPGSHRVLWYSSRPLSGQAASAGDFPDDPASGAFGYTGDAAKSVRRGAKTLHEKIPRVVHVRLYRPPAPHFVFRR